eukprot:UN07901
MRMKKSNFNMSFDCINNIMYNSEYTCSHDHNHHLRNKSRSVNIESENIWDHNDSISTITELTQSQSQYLSPPKTKKRRNANINAYFSSTTTTMDSESIINDE